MRDGVLVRVEGIPAPPLTSLLLCLCHSALEHNGLFNSSSLWGSLSPTDSQGLPGAAAAQLCLSIRPSVHPSVCPQGCSGQRRVRPGLPHRRQSRNSHPLDA